MRLVEQAAPRIERDTEVLLRVLDVGVCGTDREIARFEYGTPPAGRDHLVIGHETLARVVAAGPAVTRVAPGDLVVATVRRPCPHAWCRACPAGRQDFCFTGDYTERGIKGRHGFMSELAVEDERFLHRVPAALREVAVLLEPLTIAEKALSQVEDIQRRMPWIDRSAPGGHRARAAVLGAGPVGLLGALALLARGFDTWVYSRESPDGPKARWAESVAAHYVSSAVTRPDALAAHAGPIDLLYEATGAASVSFEAVKALGANGVFVLTGLPGGAGTLEIEAEAIMRQLVHGNQVIVGTVNAGPDDFEAAIDDLASFEQRWPAPLRSLITGRHPPQDFENLLRGPRSGIKQVLTFPETR